MIPDHVRDQINKERETCVFSARYNLEWEPPLIKTYTDFEVKKGKRHLIRIQKEYDGSVRPNRMMPKRMHIYEDWNGTLKQIHDTITLCEEQLAESKKNRDKFRNNPEKLNEFNNYGYSITYWEREIYELGKFITKTRMWIPRRKIRLAVSYNDKDYELIAAQMGNHPQLEPLFEKMRAYKVRIDEINKTRKNPRRNCHVYIEFENDSFDISDVGWEIWRHDTLHRHTQSSSSSSSSSV